MKKVLIYDPYMDTLGGGERYSLTFALACKSAGYLVEIAWPDNSILSQAESRFGMDLTSINVNSAAYSLFSGHSGVLQKLFFTRQYHTIFWVSDGSLPFIFGHHNYVHFQVPFSNFSFGRHSKWKLRFINHFIYNSRFTQKVLERKLSKEKGIVLYPPVAVDQFTPGPKRKQILSVGRFDSPSHNKRQDVLIKAFSILFASHPDYRLIIAGGLKGDNSTIDNLKSQASGLPIEFCINPEFGQLQQLYKDSQFFWHAAGYGIDENIEPENVEHFGITTVEAMAAGCIPVVIDRGGQKEIITHSENGFLCQNESEIAAFTSQVILDGSTYQKIKPVVIASAGRFSQTSFMDKVKNIV